MMAMAIQIAFVACFALALAQGPMRRRPALRHATLLCALLVIASAPLWPRLAEQVAWRGPVIGGVARIAAPVAFVHADTLASSAAATVASRPIPLRDALAAIWAIGAAVMLARFVLGLFAASSIVRRAGPVQLRDGCRYRVSAEVAGPVSVGVFRPVVLVPAPMLESLEPQQLRQILAHERAHAARGDHLVALLQRLVAAAWWPHPLVHVLNRALDRAREERCDNDVILAGHDRVEYAATLLRVADCMSGRIDAHRIAGALPFTRRRRRKSLERRIAGLVDERRTLMNRVPLPLMAVVLAAFAGGAVLLSCATGVTRAAADGGGSTLALANAPATQPSLPLHEIKFELGDTEFADGDNITIEQVLCTGEKLGIGEIAIVRGTYTLASRDEARLGFHVTATLPNPTPVDPRQEAVVKKGSGRFELRHALWDGYPHVGFYPTAAGSGFGGVYFGVGDSVLKHKGWSYKSGATGGAVDSVGGSSNPAKR